MTLGDKLSKLRKENNYTQEQLAEILGVSRQAISKWESNITYPETDKLVRLSRLFHCTTDYLLLEEEEIAAEEKQNPSGQHSSTANHIFIESPFTKNLVSCFKVTASPIIGPKENEPKYLLLGVDKVTAFGEHTTQLGWYETEEDIQKEIAAVTSAIREGKSCYTLKYSVEVDERSLSAVMKKTAVQDKQAPYFFWRYPRERKSDKTIFGMPLWHIGRQAKGFIAIGVKARGVIAIGLKAKGIVSLGLLSMGVLSLGLLSIGLMAIGTVAVGLLSAGCFSAGILATGAISLGIISLGAIAIGDFSVGALAIGKYFALGDHAMAMIAAGDTKAAGSTFQKVGELTEQDIITIKQALDAAVPAYLSWAKEFIKFFL